MFMQLYEQIMNNYWFNKMEEYAFITHKHIVHHTFALMKHINFINTHLSKLYLVDPIFENVIFQCEKFTFRWSNLFFFSFGNEIFKQNVLHITISWITINWFYFMKHIKYLVMHILDQPTISHKSMSNNCLRHISYTSFFICAWTKWLHKSIYKKP